MFELLERGNLKVLGVVKELTDYRTGVQHFDDDTVTVSELRLLTPAETQSLSATRR